MKRLVVCGDSFMSPRTEHPKKHFAEIFADRLDFDLVCYSRSGFSNGGISIQIETAIGENPDLILFNTTNADRIEFYPNSSRSDEGHLFYVKNLGDINLYSKELSDPYYEYTDDKTLISANLNSLLSKQPDDYWDTLYKKEMLSRFPDWEDKLNSIKQYLKHLYSERWKEQTDRMIMYAILHRLHLSNIPYIFVHDQLGLLHSAYDPFWIQSKNNIVEPVNTIKINSNVPKNIGFHLTYDDSRQVADLLIDHYKRHF